MKILIGTSWTKSASYESVKDLNDEYLKIYHKAGFDIENFCLTIDPPGPPLTWYNLDKAWKRGDRKLLKMYEDLLYALEGKDVFINGSGINLHPDFVQQLKVTTVFQCFDDPENSENLSKPVAASYDLCFVGNVAEVDTYKSWGAVNSFWMPTGLRNSDIDDSITEQSILEGTREIDIILLADYRSPYRKHKLEILEKAFPDGHFYGPGWKRGFLPQKKAQYLFKNSKIGPNIHNSTGPINYRLLQLPAYGVMQICDNKEHLSQVFELNKEVIGFNTIHECIELCKYYLNHDLERRMIAASGWKRVLKDYTAQEIMRKKINLISQYIKLKEDKAASSYFIALHKRKTIIKYSMFILYSFIERSMFPLYSSLRKIKFLRQMKHSIENIFSRQ